MAAGCLWLAQLKKDRLIAEASLFFQKTLSQATQLDVKIEKTSGDLTGFVKFEGVTVQDPAAPPDNRTLFTAKEIHFQYRFLDFLSKKFNSKIEVYVFSPVVHWRPQTGLRGQALPLLAWMKQWAVSQKKNLRIRIRDLEFTLGHGAEPLRGIQVDYRDNTFSLQVPLRHLDVIGADLSSVLNVSGAFEEGIFGGEDSLRGSVTTEASVVNWTPLPYESHFDYIASEKGVFITASDFLGGIEWTGGIDFESNYEVKHRVRARNYPLANLSPFVQAAQKVILPGRLDLEARFEGMPLAPHVEASARIYDGWIGNDTFKALDVHVDGIYPTLRLKDSRILLQDGGSMRFPEKTLEIRELFSGKTFVDLVKHADQDTMVWGDWQIQRPEDNEVPQLKLQKSFGENANLHIKKYPEEERRETDPTKAKDMEVSFEFRLRSEDWVKLELRDEEKFVGVERKWQF